MKILSYKPGHDGQIALIDGDQLVFSMEAKKNSFPRFSSVTVDLHIQALSQLTEAPDVVAVSGWVK